MKALQTRSPINLFYEYPNISRVNLSIWVSDTINIDTTTTPDYQLSTSAIEDLGSFEISELIRSKNQYIFNEDFYTKRDTAKYVLVKSNLLTVDDPQLTINNFKTRVEDDFGTFEAESCLLETFNPEVKYDLFRVRDGYIQRVNDVTVKELPQIFDRLIPANIGDWFESSASTTTGIQDPFNGSNAVKKTNSQSIFYTISTSLIKPLKTGTFSMYYRAYENTVLSFDTIIDGVDDGFLSMELGTKIVTFNNTGGSVDVIELNNNWNLLSISFNNFTPIDEIRISFVNSTQGDITMDFLSFSLREGDNLQSEASELILQDNYEVFTDQNISFMADKKYTNGSYQYFNLSLNDLTEQSRKVGFAGGFDNVDLIYDDLEGNETRQTLKYNQINECKHTPVKVSFINRFGVIQDLVFFKKRIDSIDTDKESYKTNVLQQGNYYPHIGQNQTIRKESKRSVTLNSGFYPEEFNTVFEQLQNSLHYWIDDEPAVLDGSSFNVKTRVNDKLINYTFDFSYSNEEVNTI